MNAMTTTRLVRGLAIVAVLSTICDRSIAAEQAPHEMLQPTKEHKMFQFDVGTWDATMKIWPSPDAKPMESKATERNAMLRGGLRALRLMSRNWSYRLSTLGLRAQPRLGRLAEQPDSVAGRDRSVG